MAEEGALAEDWTPQAYQEAIPPPWKSEQQINDNWAKYRSIQRVQGQLRLFPKHPIKQYHINHFPRIRYQLHLPHQKLKIPRILYILLISLRQRRILHLRIRNIHNSHSQSHHSRRYTILPIQDDHCAEKQEKQRFPLWFDGYDRHTNLIEVYQWPDTFNHGLHVGHHVLHL